MENFLRKSKIFDYSKSICCCCSPLLKSGLRLASIPVINSCFLSVADHISRFMSPPNLSSRSPRISGCFFMIIQYYFHIYTFEHTCIYVHNIGTFYDIYIYLFVKKFDAATWNIFIFTLNKNKLLIKFYIYNALCILVNICSK